MSKEETSGPRYRRKNTWIGAVTGYGCLGLLLFGAIFSGCGGGDPQKLYHAIEKAKQKRTIANIMNVGTAIMRWKSDQIDEGRSESSLPYEPTVEDLRQVLVPKYIKKLPWKDSWGHPLEFRIGRDLFGTHVIRISSPGRDGVFQTADDDYSTVRYLPTEYDQDIVFADGELIRSPDWRLRDPP